MTPPKPPNEPRLKRGPKPTSTTGKPLKNRVIRTDDEEWKKCLELGGSPWIRRAIQMAELPGDALPKKKKPKPKDKP